MEKVFKDFGLVNINHIQLLAEQYNTLVKECYSTYLNGYCPAAYNNISNIYDIITHLFEKKKEVIVFALDALSFNYFYSDIMPKIKNMKKKYASAITSVFPTTSATCWTSVLTNSFPSEHAIYGTSFKLEGANMNYVWHRNYFCHGNRIIPNQCKSSKFRLVLSKGNIFQFLLKKNILTYDIGHYFEDNPSNPLLDNITKGAIRIKSRKKYFDLIEKPNELLMYSLDEIKEILDYSNEKKLIWSYIDTDNFIHHHGYKLLTKIMEWEKLFDFWDDYFSEDRAFLFIADHGQIPQNNVMVDILKESESNKELCCNTGGAGRIIYVFPKPEMKQKIYKWLCDKIGDSGKIFTKEEIINAGLIKVNANGLNRIGDYIAIGYQSNFPSTGPNYLFEHGALSEDEMFVPLVVMVD